MDMRNLVENLENSSAGSLKLDTMVSYLVASSDACSETVRQALVEGDVSWEVVNQLLDDRPSPFTRSIDAAIPGENIVLAIYSTKRSRWAAVQKSADGREFLGWGATEALARRAAALKALQSERPAANGAHAPAGTVDGDAEPASEWRIRF